MRELFANDNFNLKDFLKSHKEISIEDLLKQIENVTKTVQNELFGLINGDLAHFQTILREVCEVDLEVIKQFRARIENEKIKKEVI